METQVNHYEFINLQTGNVIAYASYPVDIDKAECLAKLERKKNELATIHRVNFELIYWQEHEHSIR
ncbi:hypothetical protein DJ568_11465 [Mucilaginibacter hurinus]|uniref:Uncharacterized protein n=1 Tax=Mucilaginibacter hurinus TaxID=2201324 RepID=A0A367GLT3_9SPHI|nr:hypothetical protein [Mucilaginibacter hurinus]RCH54437.1 hypothetical protein DJ568_11465 [Mucilaginibacter hurinus]